MSWISLPPPQLCVLPLFQPFILVTDDWSLQYPQAEIIIGDDSAFYEKGVDGERGQKLKKAEITLNDCLACSYAVSLQPLLFIRKPANTVVLFAAVASPRPNPSLSRFSRTKRFTACSANSPYAL